MFLVPVYCRGSNRTPVIAREQVIPDDIHYAVDPYAFSIHAKIFKLYDSFWAINTHDIL